MIIKKLNNNKDLNQITKGDLIYKNTELNNNFIIFGDCHGDFLSLIKIINEGKYKKIIFLGDVFDPFNGEFINVPFNNTIQNIKIFDIKKKVRFAFENTIIFAYYIFYLIYKYDIDIYFILGNHDLSYSILYFYFFYMVIFSSIENTKITIYYNKLVDIKINNKKITYNLSHNKGCYNDAENNKQNYNLVFDKINETIKQSKYKVFTINYCGIPQFSRSKDYLNIKFNNCDDNIINQNKTFVNNPNSNLDVIMMPTAKKKHVIALNHYKDFCKYNHIYGHANSMFFNIKDMVFDSINFDNNNPSETYIRFECMDINYPLTDNDYGLDSTLSFYKSSTDTRNKKLKPKFCYDMECSKTSIVRNKYMIHRETIKINEEKIMTKLSDLYGIMIGYIVFISQNGIQYKNLLIPYLIHNYIMINFIILNNAKMIGGVSIKQKNNQNITSVQDPMKNFYHVPNIKHRYYLRTTIGKHSRNKIYDDIYESSKPFVNKKKRFYNNVIKEIKKQKKNKINIFNISDIDAFYNIIYSNSKKLFFNIMTKLLLNEDTQKKYSPFDFKFKIIEGNVEAPLIQFIKIIKNNYLNNQDFTNHYSLLNFNFYISDKLKKNVIDMSCQDIKGLNFEGIIPNDTNQNYNNLMLIDMEIIKLKNFICSNDYENNIKFDLNSDQNKIIKIFYKIIKDLNLDLLKISNNGTLIDLINKMFLYLMIHYYSYYFYIILSAYKILGITVYSGVNYSNNPQILKNNYIINFLYYCLYKYCNEQGFADSIANIFNEHTKDFLSVFIINNKIINIKKPEYQCIQ